MKVKIKKDKKTKVFNLVESWKDVTLESWAELIKLEDATRTKEAEETIAALSDIPKKLIRELGIQDVALILSKIAEFQATKDSSLYKIIEIEGKKYGFHPDLNAITLGEYADLEDMLVKGLHDYLPEMMAILYRPVIEEGDNGVYTIESYDGDLSIRAEKMKLMNADQVQNALVFFYRLGRGLCGTLELSMMERLKETKMQLPQNLLPKSGHGSESFTGSQKVR